MDAAINIASYTLFTCLNRASIYNVAKAERRVDIEGVALMCACVLLASCPSPKRTTQVKVPTPFSIPTPPPTPSPSPRPS